MTKYKVLYKNSKENGFVEHEIECFKFEVVPNGTLVVQREDGKANGVFAPGEWIAMIPV